MIVPFGALPGHTLSVEMREIAAHYGIRTRSLKRRDARHGEHVAAARDALFWKLIVQRKWSAERAAQAMGVSAKTASAAAQRHASQIAAFREAHGLQEAS